MKIITKNKEIDLKAKFKITSTDIPNNTQDIKLVGDDWVNLNNLNLNNVKCELGSNKYSMPIHIGNSNINKLILNAFGRDIRIFNSTINDIYIQSEINLLAFRNANIPNLHGRIDLINEIEINQ